jgi:citrate synthase
MPAVQYAALIADLMAKTKYTLAKTATPATDFYTGPVTLRMRTKEDTELIVTDF